MKNVLFISLCILVANILKAQTNIGFKAGYNYATARIYSKNVKQNSQYKSGYGFGVMFKAPFDGVLHFSPYIAYNKKGYKYLPAAENIKEIENTIHYVDIAPGVSFDFPLRQNTSFIIGFSPVFSVAISGKEKSLLSNSSVISKNMKFNFSNYSLVDIGFNGSIGYRFNRKFLLESSCLYGVANIENNDFNKRKISNLIFNLSVGYYYK